MLNYSTALSAFGAFGSVVGAVSHNIANITTQEFKSYSVDLAERPNMSGVRIGSIHRDYSPGPAIISHLSSFETSTSHNQQTFEIPNQSVPRGVESWEIKATNEYGETVATWNEAPSLAYKDPLFKTHAEGSNVDLPREFSNLSIAEHAYSANAAVIRTMDEMTGSLLNVIA